MSEAFANMDRTVPEKAGFPDRSGGRLEWKDGFSESLFGTPSLTKGCCESGKIGARMPTSARASLGVFAQLADVGIRAPEQNGLLEQAQTNDAQGCAVERNDSDRTSSRRFGLNQSREVSAFVDAFRFEFWVHSTANCTRAEAESRLSLALSFSR